VEQAVGDESSRAPKDVSSDDDDRSDVRIVGDIYTPHSVDRTEQVLAGRIQADAQ
jgi:hypothetical protein